MIPLGLHTDNIYKGQSTRKPVELRKVDSGLSFAQGLLYFCGLLPLSLNTYIFNQEVLTCNN